jgi:ribosomal protein S12 methylthiotransferase
MRRRSERPRVAVISLGCAKNRVDTEVMLASLAQAGYELTNSVPDADVVIVNACGFIDEAKRESLAAFLEVARDKKKEAKLILAGCLAQGYGPELLPELPEADAFIGPGLAGDVVSVVRRVMSGEKVIALNAAGQWENRPLPRVLTTPPGTAYLKIAEGCSHGCTFCTIPRLRGPYRSRPEKVIYEEAAQVAAAGVKEIVLVAQDTAAYGYDLYGEFRLPHLLRLLCRLDGVGWIRLLYLYPTRVRPELLKVIAEEEKICRYFDLPIQHSSPRILSLMGRPPVQRVRRVIESIRSTMPDAVLRATFIVGFPGETQQDFEDLCAFLRQVEFDWVGAFVYSPQDGTKAAQLPGQVSEEVKQERWEALMGLQRPITSKRLRRWVGQRVEVLVEKTALRGAALGRTRGQAPEVDGVVKVTGGSPQPGEIISVKITGIRGYDLLAQV